MLSTLFCFASVFAVFLSMLDFYEKISLFEDEDVAGVFRLSSFTMAKGLALPVIGLFLVFLFMFPLFREGGGGVIFFLLALVGVCLAGLRPIVRWYGTLFIVTNKRIFKIVRHGLFKKNVEEIILDLIGVVSYGTTGVWETLARAGTMKLVFKDSAREPLMFPFVSEPARMLDVISRQLHNRGAAPIVPPSPDAKDHGDEPIKSPVEKTHFVKKDLRPHVKPAFAADSGDIDSIWNE